MNFRMVFWVVSIAIMLEGGLILTGLVFSLYYGSGDHWAMFLSSGITVLTGFVLWFLTRKGVTEKFGKKESFLVVTFSWVLMSFFGALPFILSNTLPNFVDALFESMSGLTTTGASVITDVEVVPKGVLFWRSLTHWIGGMGIVGLSVTLMHFIGAGGNHLHTAEASKPVKGKIHPRIQEALKRIWGIYIVLTLLETALLMAGDMNLFESLCHTFGSVGTGGFSTRNASIGAFSPYIQYVVTVFMILGATNFSLIYFLVKGKFKNVFRDQELQLYLGIFLVLGLFAGIYLYFSSDYGMEKSLRFAFFQVASLLTTTGYAVDNYALWPVPLIVIFFFILFSGGSSGSTTGAIKLVRILIAVKAVFRQFKQSIYPNAYIPLRLNGQVLQEDLATRALIFILLYLGSFIILTLIVAMGGTGFMTSASAVAACIGSIGPGFGEVGPAGNYSAMPVYSKYVLTFAMLIGRLELFSVLLLFLPSFWKK